MNVHQLSIKSLVLFISLLLSFSSMIASALEGENSVETDAAEQEAYAYYVGVKAAEFGHPWVYMTQLRYRWTQMKDVPGYAPAGTFWHAEELINAETSTGGSGNNDTLYSLAWVDLSHEPVILSHADMPKDRYFVFQLVGFDSDNFGYVGGRATGFDAGEFALVGPNWQGELPKGIKQVIRSHTDWNWVVGRTGLTGEEDIAAARSLMDSFALTPLSQRGNQNIVLPEYSVRVPHPKSDPLGYFKMMNEAMTDMPPIEQHQHFVELFSTVNIGPNQHINEASAATQKGLARAAKDAVKQMEKIANSGIGRTVNGWVYPPSSTGIAGKKNDILTRSVFQSIYGIAAHEPEEALYLTVSKDVDGSTLNCANNYELTFKADNLPPVQDYGFWSMTIYDETFNLIDNEIDRYSIGDRTKGLTYDENGDLTIYIQGKKPSADKESNWLPCRAGESFYHVFRLYIPTQEGAKGNWAPAQHRLVK